MGIGKRSVFDAMPNQQRVADKKGFRQDSAVSNTSQINEDRPKTCKDAMFGEKARKRAFLFIVLMLAVLTIRDVYELFNEYFEYPKESEMNILFNQSMTVPNVTFCMSRKQAWSHFKINESDPVDEWDRVVDESLANMTDHDSFLGSLWDFRLVMEAYDMVATYNSLERETTAHGSARSINVFRLSPRLAGKRKTFKKWHAALNAKNVTFAEFTNKVGTETLRRSMQRFQRTTFDEDLVVRTRLRTSWISMMELCFQPWYDTDNFHGINDQGNWFTMLLSHNAENVDGSLECMSVDMHGRPSSLNRFMEGKGRARDGFTSELCPGQRHEVSVEVRAVYQMLETEDEGVACHEEEEGEDTEFMCRSRCRMEMIRGMCDCTAVSLSYLVDAEELEKYPLCDYTQCEVDVQNGNFSDEACASKCLPDCHQIRYELHQETKGRMVRPDLTLVNLNWGSFEYLTMEQSWKYTATTFIAALGGSIGMWLGLSILSLIQGGSYLYHYVTRKVKKPIRKLSNMGTDFARRGSNTGRMSTTSLDNNAGNPNVPQQKTKFSIAANPLENPFASEPAPTSRRHSRELDYEMQDVNGGVSTNPNPTRITVGK